MNSVTRSSAASSRDDAEHAMKTSKTCAVCGDVARCYHFGGLCCASCKAFFRRAVVNDEYKPYRCVYGGSCHIEITSRKHCSHCRLKRCLAIGMDKKWFMSEEMRAELKIKSTLKKMKQHTDGQPNRQVLVFDAVGQLQGCNAINPSPLSPAHIQEIHALVDLTLQAYHSNLIPDDMQGEECCGTSSNLRTAVILTTAIRRVFGFLESVPQLRQLDVVAQKVLLKERGMEALIVLSALTFNPVSRMWTSKQSPNGDSPLLQEPRPMQICVKDFERLHGSEVARKHVDTVASLLAMRADEKIIVLLSLVAFFTLEGHLDTLAARLGAHIFAIQDHFISLFKYYVLWKFGEVGESAFARFILKLSDVREVHNIRKVAPLQLSSEEIHEMERYMGGLHLI